MMVSPQTFMRECEGLSYEGLIVKRDELLDYVKDFESGELPDEGFVLTCPSPDVFYQMYLEYLSPLCARIAEVYRCEVLDDDDDEDEE